jgi:hypothetical protein
MSFTADGSAVAERRLLLDAKGKFTETMGCAGRRLFTWMPLWCVGRAVDGIDRPYEVGIWAWTFGQLFANDAVIGKVFGQSFAD